MLSSITNVIVTASEIDDNEWAVLEWINHNFQLSCSRLIAVDERSVGRAIEANVWIGAFNYLDLSWFMDLLRRAPWNMPERVRVFIKRQDDEFFSEEPLTPPQPEKMET